MIDQKFAHKRVFPLVARTKQPVIKEWQEVEAGQFEFLPNEYGIALDDTDLVVDVDPRNDGMSGLRYIDEELGLSLLSLKTPIVRTGSGGFHIWLKKPADVGVWKNKKERFPGIDFLSKGQFCVGVGSHHAIPPHALYTWHTDVHPDDALMAPEKLLEAIRKNTQILDGEGLTGLSRFDDSERNRDAYAIYLREVAPIAVEGHNGDQTTLNVCFRGRDLGLSPEVTLELALRLWNHRCLPPWHPEDLKVKVHNAYQYARKGIGNRLPEVEFADPIQIAQAQGIDPYSDNDEPRICDPYERDPICQNMSVALLPFDQKNEPGNAQVYLRKFYPGGSMVFAENEFYVWTGQAWVMRPKSLVVSHVQKTLWQCMTQSGIEKTLKAIQQRISTFFPTSAPNAMFFRNGVLSLTPGSKLTAPDRRHMNRHVLDYDFIPNAGCPQFEEFLLSSLPNELDRLLLQEWFGYCLTADTKFQKMMVLIGASRSGKGTLGRVMAAIMGGDLVATTLRTMGSRFGLYPLVGKKAAILGDQQDLKFDDATSAKEALLSIVGNDVQSVEVKFEKNFIMAPITAKLTMLCNSFPAFNDSANALLNRLLLIEFKKSFAGREDVTLDTRLREERSGIFNWALRGLERLRVQGNFTANHSESIKNVVKDAINPVNAFVKEHLCPFSQTVPVQKQRHAPLVDVYERYKIWCTNDGRTALSKARFTAALHGLGIETVRARVAGYDYPLKVLLWQKLTDYGDPDDAPWLEDILAEDRYSDVI